MRNVICQDDTQKSATPQAEGSSPLLMVCGMNGHQGHPCFVTPTMSTAHRTERPPCQQDKVLQRPPRGR